MWLYWCLLSTIISGFIPIALKKCSNNEPKRIAIMGLFLYHSIMILISLITNPEFITNLNIVDILKMLPGIIIQSIGFYCAISATKYGKVAITSSIQKAKVVVTFLLGIVILKENCTILQLIISIILVILSMLVAKSKNNKEKIDTLYVSIYEEEKNEKLAKFIYKFWDNRKMIKTFPNLKVQDTEGNILYMDSYLDIQPYYLKLK